MSGPDVTPSGRREARIEDFPSLQAFGARLLDARPRRLRRRLGAGGLSVLVAFVGTTGLALTAATGSPVPPFLRAGDESAVLRPNAASVRISTVRAPDPAGGAPWTVRVGTAGDGTRCVAVGQVRGGRLGITGRGGSFVATPAGSDAQCGQIEDGGAGAARPAVLGLRDVAGLTGGRATGTVLFGSAAPGTDHVRALMPNGRRIDASVAPDGAFVAMLPGEPRQAQPIVDVRRGTAGIKIPFQLSRTLPDPVADGRPWTLIAFGSGQRLVDGRPVGRPTPACFQITPVAPFRNGIEGSPAVCGVPRGSWAAVTPLRQGVRGRYVVGRQSRRIDWRGLPTRTLVVVRVPGERASVRLRSSGRSWAVRRAGADVVDRTHADGIYFGLLPGAVPAADVQVRIRATTTGSTGRVLAPRDLPVRQVDIRTTKRGTP